MIKSLKKLKAYRQLKGMKQKDLAQYLGVSLNTYNFKENGKQDFTLTEAKKISNYFGLSIEEIFFSDNVNKMFTKSEK